MSVMQSSKGGLAYEYRVEKTVTFANTSGTVTVFTVTGVVAVKISPVCITDLTSAAGANISLGTSDSTAGLVAATTATDIDAYELWYDATPTLEIEALSSEPAAVLSNGGDVILTLSAQVDTGAITFYCLWTPRSDDGLVVAA